MSVTNTRSPEQWRIIQEHVDVKDKWVIDLGCGYGDLLEFMRSAGAVVYGLDQEVLWPYAKQVDLSSPPLAVEFMQRHYDISICFSVIPYLTRRIAIGMLVWMRAHSDIALIEIQTEGDGPGTMTDDRIKKLLLSRWSSVEPIGETLVDYRNKWRTIWMCQ